MSRHPAYAAPLLLLALFFASPILAATSISVLTDRTDALYGVGDMVTFRISVVSDDTAVTTGSVAYSLTNDGWSTLATDSVTLSGEPAVVTGRLDRPGFLRCTVTYTDGGGEAHVGVAAAGIDPLNIAPSMPVPDDFDAFWAEKKAEVAALPMNPVLTPVASTVDGVDNFDVQIECPGGAPVSGYYCRPTDAAPKSLAAVLHVHGAGVRSSILRPDLAKEGMLVLDINAHGIPNGKKAEFYEALAKDELSDYRHRGREDRETYYFLGMYYRLIRAMNFLTEQPEWDGKVLIVSGSSQGGGQALVAAGLDSRVTALQANVPAMCEHTGAINGWPRLVPRDDDGNPDPKVFQVARYFDAMNFATRTTADALVSVGFIDNTCRPTSVYAAYNNLRGKKEMLNKPLMTHAVPPEWNETCMAMMKEQMAAVK